MLFQAQVWAHRDSAHAFVGTYERCGLLASRPCARSTAKFPSRPFEILQASSSKSFEVFHSDQGFGEGDLRDPAVSSWARCSDVSCRMPSAGQRRSDWMVRCPAMSCGMARRVHLGAAVTVFHLRFFSMGVPPGIYDISREAQFTVSIFGNGLACSRSRRRSLHWRRGIRLSQSRDVVKNKILMLMSEPQNEQVRR